MHKNAFLHSTFGAKMWNSRLMRLIPTLLSCRKEGRSSTGNESRRLKGDNTEAEEGRKARVEELHKNFL